MLTRSTVTFLLFASVLGSATAQGPQGTPRAKEAALKRLQSAPSKYRVFALVAFIEEQIASRAMFAGQYSALRDLGFDVEGTLESWVEKAPVEAGSPPHFRLHCVAALRDVVQGTGSESLRKKLQQIADAKYGDRTLKHAVMYALAQFGVRKYVDKMEAQYESMTKETTPRRQAMGWQALADLRYRTRQYPEAVKAFLRLFELIDEGRIAPPRSSLPTYIYNAACSMALAGRLDAAFAHVEKALTTGKASGYPLSRQMLETDMDIATLRKDARFRPLMAKYFGAAKK